MANAFISTGSIYKVRYVNVGILACNFKITYKRKTLWCRLGVKIRVYVGASKTLLIVTSLGGDNNVATYGNNIVSFPSRAW